MSELGSEIDIVASDREMEELGRFIVEKVCFRDVEKEDEAGCEEGAQDEGRGRIRKTPGSLGVVFGDVFGSAEDMERESEQAKRRCLVLYERCSGEDRNRNKDLGAEDEPARIEYTLSARAKQQEANSSAEESGVEDGINCKAICVESDSGKGDDSEGDNSEGDSSESDNSERFEDVGEEDSGVDLEGDSASEGAEAEEASKIPGSSSPREGPNSEECGRDCDGECKKTVNFLASTDRSKNSTTAARLEDIDLCNIESVESDTATSEEHQLRRASSEETENNPAESVSGVWKMENTVGDTKNRAQKVAEASASLSEDETAPKHEFDEKDTLEIAEDAVDTALDEKKSPQNSSETSEEKSASPFTPKTSKSHWSMGEAGERSSTYCEGLANTNVAQNVYSEYLPSLGVGSSDGILRVSVDTVADLVRRKEKAVIVDCRFEYEYEGGHIHTAKNITTQQEISHLFQTLKKSKEKEIVVIFYCEYSSVRAPRLAMYLRNEDRMSSTYPCLKIPNVYVMNGGYKSFFKKYPELCIPCSYIPM